MSYRESDLSGEFQLLKGIHFWNTNFAAEMAAIITALGTDTTTHDHTIEARSAALTIGTPNGSNKTRLTNDAILLINAAKGGGLTNQQIIYAIDDSIGTLHPPANIDVPWASSNGVIAGSVCSCTVGNWAGAPTGYTYQWKRDGTTNLGTAANYTLVAADVPGHLITCIVTATNATGSTAAPPSNAIET